MTRRVVVTGLGIISPVGNDIASAWDSIVAGRSGIGPVTRFDASSFPTRIAGEVKGFDVAAYMSPKEARHFDTFIHYGIAAGTQAFRDSGIEVSEANADRIGVVIGSGIGGLPLIEDTHAELTSRGVRRVSPFFVPGSIINMISGQLSIMFGLRGPNYAVVSACTTGLHCIGDAARMIAHDDADVIVAGGAESTISPLGLGGFCAARALSTRNDDPLTASRPWDRDRDGFVLGEGAGVMVLEEYEHARRRGARIYAEIAGFGMSATPTRVLVFLQHHDPAAACRRRFGTRRWRATRSITSMRTAPPPPLVTVMKPTPSRPRWVSRQRARWLSTAPNP